MSPSASVGTASVMDQYYTAPHVAALCLQTLRGALNVDDLDGFNCVEPSAGTGAFLHLLPAGTLAVDLDPKTEGIVRQDFHDFRKIFLHRRAIAVGNPPFGKNASLAVSFFNHAASICHVVAFVVPRTFRKASLQTRLDKRFHLIAEIDLPNDSFIYEGKPYDVPCVFQVWKRHRYVWREMSDGALEHPDLTFLNKDQMSLDDPQAIAIQRVGTNAGAIKEDWPTCSAASHYFMSVSDAVFDRLLEIDFDTVRHDTAGNPSVSKRELIALYEATLNK